MVAEGPDGKPAWRKVLQAAVPLPIFYCAIAATQPIRMLGKPLVGACVGARGLAAALLGLCLYAPFAHGAAAAGDEERLQLDSRPTVRAGPG